MAFSRTWNATYEGSPADTDQAKQGALRIREVKQDVRERAEVDHFWQDDTHGGKHKQVTLPERASDPSSAANQGILYTKDDGSGNTELYYIDAGGRVAKLTTQGTVSPSGKVQVSSDDSTPDFLSGKIVGSGITVAVLNDGADEDLQLSITDGAISQAKLKTTTGDVSVSKASGTSVSEERVLPGGEYGFIPRSSGSGVDAVYTIRLEKRGNHSLGSYAVLQIGSFSGGANSMTVSQRYVQSSPPYESYRKGDAIPLFIFALVQKADGFIKGTYVAEDPPWANNGPTVINPLGRLHYLLRQRIPQNLSLEDEIEAWADIEDQIKDPKTLKEFANILAAPVPQEEKNRDMALIPHPFPDYDPVKEVVVVLQPTDCRFMRGLHARFIYGGDRISDILHGGYMEIDNTPMPGLNTPFNVMAVSCRLKNNRKR